MPPSSAPAQKKMSARAIARAVREMILRREIHPGDRLREVELAEQFDVSRGRVREALTALESAGVVKIEHRRGATVRRLTDLETRDAQDLATVLMAFAVERAAERASAEERAGLLAAADRLVGPDAQKSSYEYLQALGVLTRQITQACHNPSVARMVESIVLGGPPAMHSPAGLISPRRRRQAGEGWRLLARMIADGEPSKAGAQLRKIHKRSLAAMGAFDA